MSRYLMSAFGARQLGGDNIPVIRVSV